MLPDNMYHVGGDPRMRKGCPAHILIKVVVQDDAVVASTIFTLILWRNLTEVISILY
jgi:hypothetical protein